ncbi:hypothetical protein [Paenarthrobacter sp. PH39-S1]|uniref:hypothetical protein n=1 Tax=Micrococcaceae TaxID=1268 RepID=UPI0024B8AEF6|nr:hypothetical protein [Paenarthrobacter sp. PH39-S1]MDJ0358001.1 hypothetical protein [Paenarthrobacter sp. PH39-S1]
MASGLSAACSLVMIRVSAPGRRFLVRSETKTITTKAVGTVQAAGWARSSCANPVLASDELNNIAPPHLWWPS